MAEVQCIAQDSRHPDGSRRMRVVLKARGPRVGRHWTRTLMRCAQVRIQQRRRWTRTTQSRHAHPVAPNHLARQFTGAAPNQGWAGEIRSLWTQEGWR